MSHTALARRYRPRRFADVASQAHVSETLRRAVAGNRVGHAYLFCGPRGVGKTTLARVLAMALNCPRRGADAEPCGECESCARIWAGQTALDVVEIDAASNRGVDDARDLRERAMYAPSEEGRYKVYILDEAHMLTREAWNALLKVLEEPPPRVIFVFATTEPQKIQQSASPILSRCQRFDFHRIGVAEIVDRLVQVLGQEGLDAPADALRLIARRADGGMRDALSLLDQVLALTGGQVSQEAVRAVLGLVEEERYLDLFAILRQGRHGHVFRFVQELLDTGYDLVEFYHGLVDALRMLLRLRLGGVDPEEELPEGVRDDFREAAQGFEAADLVRMLALATELESSGSLRRSANPRMLLEMLLLRLSYLDRSLAVEELIRALGGAPPGDEGRTFPPSPGQESGGRAPTAQPSLREAREGPASDRGVPGARSGSPPPDLRSEWLRFLQSSAVPPGFGPFLRAARFEEAEEGRVRLRLPPGPALERLREPAGLHTLEEALSRHTGRRLRVVPEEVGSGGGDSPAPRVSREAVREGRLKELLDREPLLEQAVVELDLELLE